MIGSNGNPRAFRMSGVASSSAFGRTIPKSRVSSEVTNGAGKAYKKFVMKKKYKKAPKLGTGTRFANLKRTLGSRKGKKKIKNPGALAASIGRKKYGPKKFAQLAAKGRKRA